MKRTLLIAAFSFLVLGCEGGKAKVKGRVVENGQPMSFVSNQAALEISPINAEGEPDKTKMFTAVVNEDGTFEVFASGGELPTGKYQVAFRAYGKLVDKYRLIAPVQRELKAGMNELTIDLAKPE